MKRPPGDPLGGNGYDVEVSPPHIAEAFGLADKELALHRRFVLVEDDETICLIDSWEPRDISETVGGREALTRSPGAAMSLDNSKPLAAKSPG